jgi:hypothetical protein
LQARRREAVSPRACAEGWAERKEQIKGPRLTLDASLLSVRLVSGGIDSSLWSNRLRLISPCGLSVGFTTTSEPLFNVDLDIKKADNWARV